MGNIKMCRVDARLVHGQVAARWTKYLDAKKIVIISDSVAKDSFMVQLFELAAPVGTKVLCLPIADAVVEWKKDAFGDGNIIVLFQDIKTAKAAFDAGYRFPKLDIGQVPGGEGRKHAVETVSLSNEEVKTLLEINKEGGEVYFQSLPDVVPVALATIAKKFDIQG